MVRVVFHYQSITTKGEKMGRHYNGDIEGKFWFGVQSSDDASFFGGVIEEPSEINYHFNSRNDMKSVVLGLEKVKEKLGANKDLLDKFFKEHDGYNNKMIEDPRARHHASRNPRKDRSLIRLMILGFILKARSENAGPLQRIISYCLVSQSVKKEVITSHI